MTKIVFFHFATAKEAWADQAADLYQKKIGYFFKFEIQALKPKKSSREDAEYKKNEEAKILFENIQGDDFVILFDEKGKTLNSIEFSKKFENALGSSKKRLIFVIGGAYGVTAAVKERADLMINLSPMTMNHLLAQTVALEQIYRSFTILKNLPYHNI